MCNGGKQVSFTANEKAGSELFFDANGRSTVYLYTYPRTRDLEGNFKDYYSKETMHFDVYDSNGRKLTYGLQFENTYGLSSTLDENIITFSSEYTFKSGDIVTIACGKGKYVNVETVGDLDTMFVDIDAHGDSYYYEDDTYYEDVNSDGDYWYDYNAVLSLRVNNNDGTISFKVKAYNNPDATIRLKVLISN